MIKLLIIADDFTGALDTGVQFAGKGIATKVLSRFPTGKTELEQIDAEVLVVDAETRHLLEDKAYERVCKLVERAKEIPIPYIYKKTDSGLRGNIGKELEAALAASGERYLTFIPALPAMNRITVNGIQYVDGVPIHKSVFGRDPFEPVVSPRVEDLFRNVSIKTAVYRESSCCERGGEREIGIFDATNERQIEIIARKLIAHGQMGVMAGCSGFASVLGNCLKLETKKMPIPAITNKMIVVCGSVNEITKQQIEYAERNGIKRVTMTPAQQFTRGYLDSEEGNAWLKGLKCDCDRDITCVIETGISDQKKVAEYRKEYKIPLEEARAAISKTLGKILKRLFEMGLEATAMIIGGDTLAGFIAEMQCEEITVYRELALGTVLSSIKIGERDQWIISKSGGFGEPELLTEIDQMVKRRQVTR